MTVDELKTFVDAHKVTQLNPAASLDNFSGFSSGSTDTVTQWSFGDGRGPADHLRDLLARRLVRAGRYQEVLKFDTHKDTQIQPVVSLDNLAMLPDKPDSIDAWG